MQNPSYIQSIFSYQSNMCGILPWMCGLFMNLTAFHLGLYSLHLLLLKNSMVLAFAFANFYTLFSVEKWMYLGSEAVLVYHCDSQFSFTCCKYWLPALPLFYHSQ